MQQSLRDVTGVVLRRALFRHDGRRLDLFARQRRSAMKLVKLYKVKEQEILWPPQHLCGQLPEVPKQPVRDEEIEDETPRHFTKSTLLIRGPELVHTEFIHKQFGVVALLGGWMHHENFEETRRILNRRLNDERFAIWRVDPPWLPRRKKARGNKMSTGKQSVIGTTVSTSIHHYVTPVRQGRVVVELGGRIGNDEARKMLGEVAHKLPFPCKCYSYEEFVEARALRERMTRENINPWTWDFIMKWNMQDCARWLTPYDRFWGGKYR